MMLNLFKPKRKQCCKCFNTFYQTEITYAIDGYTLFEVSPCCKTDWIIV
jgi:hypothetical protein